jgi:hypothetical protein
MYEDSFDTMRALREAVEAAREEEGVSVEGYYDADDKGPDPFERCDPDGGFHAASEAEIARRRGSFRGYVELKFSAAWSPKRIRKFFDRWRCRVIGTDEPACDDDDACDGEPRPDDSDFGPPPPFEPDAAQPRWWREM